MNNAPAFAKANRRLEQYGFELTEVHYDGVESANASLNVFQAEQAEQVDGTWSDGTDWVQLSFDNEGFAAYAQSPGMERFTTVEQVTADL